MPATNDLMGRAEHMLAHGQVAEAVALVRRAAAARDANALMRLATWHLIGDPLPRDLQASRRFLRAAVDIGHVDAALMEIALTANGSGAEPDWAHALKLLQRAAANDPVARDQLALVSAMRVDDAGKPVDAIRRQQISADPDVWLLPALFTPDECAHVANASLPVMESALVHDPRTGRLQQNPVRTSDAGIIGPTREDLVVRTLNLRIAAASATDVAGGEPLVVLRYAPGQQYRPHLDALPMAANQRIWTLIVYLNEGYAGGETDFGDIGLKVKGRIGDGLLFRNADGQGRPLPRSRHAGLPVLRGVKWICTRWIRAAPLDLWGR